MPQDQAGHYFSEVDNIRVTYIPAANRAAGKDWSGSDVIRIQSYKNPARHRALQQGAEFPVPSPDALIRFIETLCTAYHGGRSPRNL